MYTIKLALTGKQEFYYKLWLYEKSYFIGILAPNKILLR